MDSVFITKFVVLGILLVLSAFFASAESALFSLGPFRIRRIKKMALKSYRASQKLLSEPSKLISTILIGNEISNNAIGIVGASIVYGFFKGRIENDSYLPLLAIILVFPFLAILGEIVPKSIGMKHAEKVAAFIGVPLYVFSYVVFPIRIVIFWIPRFFLWLIGESEKKTHSISEDVFRSMVDAGTEEGILNPQEQKLIHNVFTLDDIKVVSIMTPKEQVSCLTNSMTVGQVMERFDKDRYSRFPVFDPNQQTIVGVLYAKDLLAPEPADSQKSISSYLRAPICILAETSALELFAQFRMKKSHFSVVVDREAHMMGVVTLEDILEEIFGDIRDERDLEEDPSSKQLS